MPRPNPRIGAGTGIGGLSLAGAGISNLNGAILHTQSGRNGAIKTFRQYPFVPWDTLEKQIVWKQGQHVLCIGGTGSGKTTLAARMQRRRSHVVVMVSKGVDPTFRKEYGNYDIIRSWPPPRDYMDRVILWPDKGKTGREIRDHKKLVFRHAFDTILFHEGGWCVSIDEMHYQADTLGLEPEITDMEEQGRSNDITIWGNSQRPSSIGLAPYVNMFHGFFFLANEEYDVRRLASLSKSGTTAAEMEANIRHLQLHEFVYIDRYGKVPPVRSMLKL